MKNKFKLLSLLLIANGVYGQAPLTNTDPAGNASGRNSQQYWSRGGNTDNLGTNNVFGTLWNSPIYTQTAGITRMVLRGGGTGNNAGRMKLGNNLIGAFTPANRLHLQQTGGDLY